MGSIGYIGNWNGNTITAIVLLAVVPFGCNKNSRENNLIIVMGV